MTSFQNAETSETGPQSSAPPNQAAPPAEPATAPPDKTVRAAEINLADCRISAPAREPAVAAAKPDSSLTAPVRTEAQVASGEKAEPGKLGRLLGWVLRAYQREWVTMPLNIACLAISTPIAAGVSFLAERAGYPILGVSALAAVANTTAYNLIMLPVLAWKDRAELFCGETGKFSWRNAREKARELLSYAAVIECSYLLTWPLTQSALMFSGTAAAKATLLTQGLFFLGSCIGMPIVKSFFRHRREKALAAAAAADKREKQEEVLAGSDR